MVQNMSFFCCPNCSHTTHIFGKDGATATAKQMGFDILADVPLHPDVCTTSDRGKPIVVSEPESLHAQVYREMAGRVVGKLEGPR